MRRLFPIFVVLAMSPLAFGQPAEVKRVLRTFDFEERRLGNAEDLPMHWSKVRGAGLPHYVNGRLATDLAHSGKYSFRLDLDGGSLIYRYDNGQMKVTAGAHYRIEGYCRTTLLSHARARLTAYFTDVDGRTIADTVRHSELYAAQTADESWKKLSVELSAESPKAAWLVLELALLQPSLYAPATLGQRTLSVQDIRGTVWFDDVTVSQVPRVTITTERPGNIFRRGEPVRLQVRLDDRFTEDLQAQLIVRDARGKTVYQRSGALDMSAAEAIGPGRKRTAMLLPELAAGWYDASLVMSSQGQSLGSQHMPLIQLADNAPPAHPDGRFGFIATSLPFDGWDELPQLLPMLSAGRVKLAIWSDAGDIQQMDPGAFDNLLQRLQELGITPTACLLDLPPTMADRLRAIAGDRPTGDVGDWKTGPSAWGNDSGKKKSEAADAEKAGGSSIAEKEGPVADAAARPLQNLPAPARSSLPLLLRADPADWQPQLAYLISRHANHLDRWQLGPDGSDAFVTDPNMRRVYQMIYREFSRLVQTPDLAMPWPAWYEMEGELPATVALSVPSTIVLPPQVPLYMQDLRSREGHNLSLSLDALERERYGRDAQIRDLAQRVVYALAADAKRIDLPLPFNVRRNEAGALVKEPQELLLVLRTLITTLSGATYRGRVPIDDGVEAFLFDRNGEGVMAIWDRGSAGGVRELALNLGKRPVSIDLWGNVSPLLPKAPPTDGRTAAPGDVKLRLGTMPIFLVDIDGQLAQTRASVALDRPLIESSFAPHSRRIHFVNAYRQPITGTMKLRAPAGWSLTPATFSFSLNPGESFDRDLQIELPYNTTAGKKTVQADFVLQGETSAAFTTPIIVSIGLSDVGIQTIALRDGADIVVQQMVTNYGDKSISYGAFAMFPGQARQERIINGLAAGQTTMKRYRFMNVKMAEGAKVRAGVKELTGTRILNDEVGVQ